MSNIQLGNNIRNWRTVKGIKQQTLAAKLNITPAALSNIENGKTNINMERLGNIAIELQIPVPQLMNDPFVLFQST